MAGSRILAPLGLTSTAFDDLRRVMPYRARRYSYYNVTTFDSLAVPQRVPEWDYSHNIAGGNMVATTAELARFARVVTRPERSLARIAAHAAHCTDDRVRDVPDRVRLVRAGGQRHAAVPVGDQWSNAGLQAAPVSLSGRGSRGARADQQVGDELTVGRLRQRVAGADGAAVSGGTMSRRSTPGVSSRAASVFQHVLLT